MSILPVKKSKHQRGTAAPRQAIPDTQKKRMRTDPHPLKTKTNPKQCFTKKIELGFAQYGGPGGIRTLDLSDANRTLSQLSYRPMSLRLNQCNPFCAKSQEQNKNFVGPKGDRSCNIRFLLRTAVFRTLIALHYK